MSKIKKFFSRKKEEAAFKLKLGSIGQGHALNAPSSTSSTSERRSTHDVYVPPNRRHLSGEASAAAKAALARIEKKDSKDLNISLIAIKAQAKRELEAERKLSLQSDGDSAQGTTSNTTENKNLACPGVFFRCPLISDEVLPKREWKIKVKEFLYQQLEYERGLTACLIIHNCNTKEKAEDCIQTLCKYIENIMSHPDEEKYCKIRMSNRIFTEKVRYVEGALEFLRAAGFSEVEIDGEPFLIYSVENIEEGNDLPSLLEALKTAESIQLELDRNLKVLLPSQVRRVVLPDDFYRISPEEIKREQQLRTEAIENSQILKTKAVREREEQRILRMYRYSLIRIKFPNGIYIQGTFNVYEKISDVFEFVQSVMIDETMAFQLVPYGEGKINQEDMDKSLYDMRLVPNAVLLFAVPEQDVADMNFLKEEFLMLVQSL